MLNYILARINDEVAKRLLRDKIALEGFVNGYLNVLYDIENRPYIFFGRDSEQEVKELLSKYGINLEDKLRFISKDEVASVLNDDKPAPEYPARIPISKN